MSQKIGIIGGAFSPPTLGHVALAKYVIKCGIVDNVWLVPCYKHVFGKEMATTKQRLEMCRLAVKKYDRIKVCDYEIIHKLKGKTYNFLKKLLAEDFSKKYNFSYIIGLDNANTFNKWVKFRKLEKMIRFIVVGRQGIKRDENVNWYLNPPHIYLTPDKKDIPEVSSTQARNCISEGNLKMLGKLVDPEVLKYLVTHKLYTNLTARKHSKLNI